MTRIGRTSQNFVKFKKFGNINLCYNRWKGLLDVEYPNEEEENEIAQNLKKSYIHNDATISPIFPFAKVIRWIIEDTNVNTKNILNEQGKCIGSFAPTDLEAYYKFSKFEIYFINECIKDFIHPHNYHDILA